MNKIMSIGIFTMLIGIFMMVSVIFLLSVGIPMGANIGKLPVLMPFIVEVFGVVLFGSGLSSE